MAAPVAEQNPEGEWQPRSQIAQNQQSEMPLVQDWMEAPGISIGQVLICDIREQALTDSVLRMWKIGEASTI